LFIILEGVDGSGKSTLADKIDAKFDALGGCIRTHLGPPASPATVLSQCIDDEPYGSYAPNSGVNIVADRLHWGCPAYGPVYRPEHDLDGYGDFGRAGWRYAELHLASRGAVTVLVDVRAETAARRIRERNSENSYTVEEILHGVNEVILKYQWLVDDSITLEVRLDEPTMGMLDMAVEQIITRAAKRQFEVNDLIPFPDYIGTPFPETLVIAPPVREERLAFLNELAADQWQNVGIVSSRYSFDQLDYLLRAINCPEVLAIGPLPQDADAFVYQHSGKVAASLESAARSL